MAEQKNFLGMRVEGEVYNSYRDAVPQLSEEEVDALFAGVIGLRGVRGIAWTQYTPYFNDGDVCEFGIGEVSFALDGVEGKPDGHYFDYGWMEDDFEENGRVWLNTYDNAFDEIVGSRKGTYEGKYPHGHTVYTNDVKNPVLFYPIFKLLTAIGTGSCNNVLLSKFGDHVIVKIDVDAGVVVLDEYSHD